MGFAFVPLYVQYLGIEAYGLIGFYASMQVWFALLDMGMAPALSREMARFNVGAHTPHSILTLFHSLKVVYFAVALFLAATVALGSSWIATNWLRVESLPSSTVAHALILIGCVAALRWIGALYRGALIGLQRQVWLSSWNAVFSTLRGAAAVGVLAWISPTLEVFFVFQGAVGVFEITVLGLGTRRALPSQPLPVKFSIEALKEIWSFAAGMAVITMLSILLSQVDKLLLSRFLPLSQFGYFTLAYTCASVLHVLTTPVGNAAYPRLTELVTQGNARELASAYHFFCQVVGVVVVPVALTLSLFAGQVLLLWTHNDATAAAVAPLFSLLVIGNMMNSLMHIPYNLQLAHGWTQFTVKVNTIALSLLVPFVYFGVQRFGAAAAAWAWVSLNASYLLIAVPLMHRKLLRAEKWRWYRSDLVAPLAAALAGVAAVKFLVAPATGTSSLQMLSVLFLSVVAGAASALLAVPQLRNRTLAWWKVARS